MCYHIFHKLTAKYLREKYKAEADKALDNIKFYHVSGFTHPQLPLLTQENKKEFNLFHWGLIPSWCPNEEKAYEFSNMALNAKAETIFEKPMFRDGVTCKRCILPVNGFYEWHEFNKVKYPYFIYPENDEVFTLGCISDSWTDKLTGEILNTFAIVTTEANSIMAEIHNKKKRMPLILDEEGWGKWINNSSSVMEIKELMKPAPSEWLKFHTISKVISNPAKDSNYPEIIEELRYPELENKLF